MNDKAAPPTRPMLDKFHELQKGSIPDSTPPEVAELMRLAFYGGAAAVVNLFENVSDDDKIAERQVLAIKAEIRSVNDKCPIGKDGKRCKWTEGHLTPHEFV